MKTMRFELALTVAILLFCCWCAYMILRINSSVASVVEQPTSQFQQDAFNQNSHQSRPSQVFYANKQPEATSPTAFYVGPASGNFYQNASLRVNHQLDAPQLKPPYSAQVSNWPLVAQRPPPASWQVSSNQWQTQRPNQTQQLVWRPRIAQPVQVEAEPEQEQDQDESGNAEEAGQEQSLQEDPDGAGSELEERSGGRQFSEDLSDASERDQQGRLINKRSKHLINGRQVKPNRKARKGVRDFERVVSEIDDQNAAQTSEEYDEQPDSRQPQESRPRPTRVRRPDSGEKRRQKKPAELHEHQMSESLQAQHWDDDASTKQPSESNATASTTTDEDAAEDELQTTTESPMQQEEVEFKDLDLFPDSAKLPFLDASEFELARRKKREIGLNVDTSNASDIRAAGESAPNSSLCAHPKLCANHLKGINIHAPSANKSASAASQVEELVGEEDFSVQLVGRPPIDQQPVSANTFYLPSPAEQVAVDGYHQHQPDGQQWTSSYQPLAELVSTSHEYLPIGSHAKVSKKKTKKKFKKSKMSDAKYKAAKAHAMKKKGGFKKGDMMRRKKHSKKSLVHRDKHFQGRTKGSKRDKSQGQKGAKKGNLYYSDKGFKKKGFKKAYKRLEAGDHKTYFNEFRDKDHNKKWKKFKDNHEYSQSKKWNGKDLKKFHKSKQNQSKKRNSAHGAWREKAASKAKKDYKYKKSS